jgi:hypothetical protein
VIESRKSRTTRPNRSINAPVVGCGAAASGTTVEATEVDPNSFSGRGVVQIEVRIEYI